MKYFFIKIEYYRGDSVKIKVLTSEMYSWEYNDYLKKNINKQKNKINNSKDYTEEEKKLIIKGLNLAINRIDQVFTEDADLRKLLGYE